MQEVYWNIRKKLFSIRERGKVIAHSRHIIVNHPSFVVQEGGRQRVLREKRKNVHAFVRGYASSFDDAPFGDLYLSSIKLQGRKVTYNPYRGPKFLVNGKEVISEAQQAVLTVEGEKPRMYAI